MAKRSFRRRLAEAREDFFRSISEKFGGATDYFEWMFHQFYDGVVGLCSGIGRLLYPKSVVDRAKRKLEQRAQERGVDVEPRGVGKVTEKLDYAFFRFAEGVKSLFGWLYGLIVPAKLIESTEKAVATKTADAFWDIRHRLKKIGERIAPKWLRTRIGQLYDGAAAVFTFWSAWTKTRNFRQLLWAIPAVMLAMPMLGSLVYSAIYTRADKIRHYQVALATAIEERDAGSEQLCFDKLAQLGFERTERNEYVAAVTLSKEPGKWDEAVRRFEAIAPMDEPGFAPAHLWLASNLINEKIHTDNLWGLVRTHAQHALARSTGRDRQLRNLARSFLVECDLRQNRVSEAMEDMEDLSGEFPIMHVDLMHRYIAQGQVAAATRHARRVDSLFLEHTSEGERTSEAEHTSEGDDEPTSTWFRTEEAYLSWATAQRVLNKVPRALEILEMARDELPESEDVRQALVEIYGKRLAASSLSDPNLLAEMRRLLKLEPNHIAVVEILVRGVLNDDPEATRCMESLREEELLPAETLVRLADIRASVGDYPAATAYYEQACESDPGLARAWNNLAWVRGNAEPADLQAAVEAADKAIAADPNPRFLETRGQLYVRLENWPKAIADLERALNGSLPASGPAHESLALAYEKMGNVEQAEAHRRLVDLNK